MYDGTQQLVLHEGNALSSILTQKENEAKHLQQQINKAQVCIGSVDVRISVCFATLP